VRVYCCIPNVFKGFRELESFNSEVSKAWSQKGDIFPMYDSVTGEIFECAFNVEYSVITAYAEVSIERFREKLTSAAQNLIQSRVQLAIAEASEEAARIYSSISYAEKIGLLRFKG
jgi:hypothetical protein